MLLEGLKFKGAANKVAEKMFDNKGKEDLSIGKLTDYKVLDEYKVTAKGPEPPEPIEDWSSLPEDIQEALKECGYEKPTPIQKYSISCFRNKRPLIAISPTGSGKTLGYALPLLEAVRDDKSQDLEGVILVPTRELASQVFRQFKRFSEKITTKVELLRKGRKFPHCRIIIATPKRLIEFAEKLKTVKYVVLDEADYLLSHSFVKQTDAVLKELDTENVYFSLFSATMTPQVEESARSFMGNVVRIQIGDDRAIAPNIHQELKFVGTETGKLLELKQRIETGTLGLPAMIFVMNKSRAYQLAKQISLPTAVLTSDESDSERAEAIRRVRMGEANILIATDLGGRGIDIAALSTVVNYDMPVDSTTYIHRIGRTARAGRGGKSITLFTVDDQTNLRPVASVMKQYGYDVEDYMLKKDKNKRGARALFEPTKRKQIAGDSWNVGRAMSKREKRKLGLLPAATD